ncbi:MAG: T9SS type A sorting domain-containing protein [bacterium]
MLCRKLIRKFAGAFVLTLLLASNVSATWNKVAQLAEPINCVFFTDPNHGFIGTGAQGLNLSLQIWITNNGGVSWIQAGVPVGDGEVTQIAVNPNGVGYASITSENNPRHNLWKTTDGGYSWQDVSVGNRYGTGVDGNGVVAFWNNPINSPGNTNGVFTMRGGTTLITPGPYDPKHGEAWGAYGDSAQHLWYIITEQSRTLYISSDGTTWKSRFGFGSLMTGGFLTGAIIGIGNTLYVQTERDGIFRGSTLDSAKTWTSIGGPSNTYDTRTLFASGCSGQMLLAFDKTGGLWRSDDGGDGTRASTTPIAITHIDFFSITSCQNSTKKATFKNKICPPFVITSVSLINNPSGVFSLTNSPTLPDTLAPGEIDTFTVFFNPNLKPGGYTAQIEVKGHYESTDGLPEVTIDSLIHVIGTAQPVGPSIETNLQTIDFGRSSICGGEVDSFFTIKNTGCDTVQVIAGPGKIDSAFTSDTIHFPYSLPPGATINIHFHFRPTIAKSFSDFPTFNVLAQGKGQDVKFNVIGVGVPGTGLLSYPQQVVDFDTLSICGNDSVTTFFTNTGCGELVVDSLIAQGHFHLAGNSITQGMKIMPGDTVRLTFYPGDANAPLKKGIDSGHLLITFTGGLPPKNFLVPFVGYIGDGTRELVASLNNIDFGIASPCSPEKDTTINLFNSGCDTLQIFGASLAATGFMLSGNNFPISIPPGKSALLHMSTLLDTTNAKVANLDSITIFSNSDHAIGAINLRRRITAHREVGFYLDATAARGTDQGVVTFELKESPTKPFAGSGVKQIDFDLIHNSDLIEFIPSRSSSWLSGSANGNTFSIQNNSEISPDTNGVLATAAFRVYLTKDASTTLALTKASIPGIDTAVDPCAMSLSYGGSATFNYDFVCAEPTIAKFMNGTLPLKIIALYPNPSKDEISLTLESTTPQTAQVEIFNLIGENVLSQTIRLGVGSTTNKIRTSMLPQGIYQLRFGSQLRTFMQIR